MITQIVTRDSWLKCYTDTYKWGKPNLTFELIQEHYGISHWEKINFDEYRLTFVDEKKMIYWMLKWS